MEALSDERRNDGAQCSVHTGFLVFVFHGGEARIDINRSCRMVYGRPAVVGKGFSLASEIEISLDV